MQGRWDEFIFFLEASGCFAAGRATTGFAIASAASFAALSPVAGFAAFRIPSPGRNYRHCEAVGRGNPDVLGWPLEPPRLIGSTGFAATVADLLSAPSAASPFVFGHLLCPNRKKGCATARLFYDHSLRFESCQVSLINS